MVNEHNPSSPELNWSWDMDKEEFLGDLVTEEEFYNRASDDDGKSDTLLAKIAPETARIIDTLVFMAHEKYGYPCKTRPDFIRFCVIAGMKLLVKTLEINDSEIINHLSYLSQMQREAHFFDSLAKVRSQISSIEKGLDILIQIKEFQEARKHLIQYIQSATQLGISNEFLMRMYIKEFFNSDKIRAALDEIDSEIGEGTVISNARMAHDRIKREENEE